MNHLCQERATPLLRSVSASDRPLHVAVVDEELPYPLTSGKRIRTMNLLQRLARRHRISYLCHRNRDAREAEAAARHCREQGMEVHFADSIAPAGTALASGPVFYAKLFANLFSAQPYVVRANDSADLRRCVEDFAARETVDLWHCEWTPYLEALRGLPRARRLVVAHNVESLIWQRYQETEANWLKRWYIGKQRRKFEDYERWAFSAVDQLVTVSDADAELARERFGAPRVSVVDNGVDTAYFRPTESRRRAQDLLFLGSLDWRPNLDAVRLLLDDIFPKIRRALPAARLFIVGRNPPVWLPAAVRRVPGVELAANVADVRGYLHTCGVMLVPLRIGGGSRLKILEALAGELPVISTRVGAEGLHLEGGRHLVIVDDIADFAPAVLEHVRLPAALQAMTRAGSEAVRARYDWDLLADHLEQAWFDCVAAR